MNKKLVLAAACSFICSSKSFAEEEKKVSVLIQQSTYVYGGATNKVKPDGGDELSSADSYSATMPNDFTAIFYYDNYSVYLFPTQEGAAYGFGYFPKEEIEIGAYFGVNSQKVGKQGVTEADYKSSDSIELGAFAYYYMKNVGGDGSLEFGLDVGFSSEKTESFPENNVVTKTNTSGNGILLSAAYVNPIWGSLSMVHGLSFSMTSSEEKETKEKKSSTGWELNLAAIRVEF